MEALRSDCLGLDSWSLLEKQIYVVNLELLPAGIEALLS